MAKLHVSARRAFPLKAVLLKYRNTDTSRYYVTALFRNNLSAIYKENDPNIYIVKHALLPSLAFTAEHVG